MKIFISAITLLLLSSNVFSMTSRWIGEPGARRMSIRSTDGRSVERAPFFKFTKEELVFKKEVKLQKSDLFLKRSIKVGIVKSYYSDVTGRGRILCDSFALCPVGDSMFDVSELKIKVIFKKNSKPVNGEVLTLIFTETLLPWSEIPHLSVEAKSSNTSKFLKAEILTKKRLVLDRLYLYQTDYSVVEVSLE